jgi:alkylation response protein AidB-like acyl-CoA dehydrogenase
MISFDPTEDQQLILGTVSELARSSLLPRAREFEKARAVSPEIRRAAQELSLAMAHVPEAVGGQGLGLLTALLINEELATGDAAAAFSLPGFGSFSLAVLELATEEQARRLLAPFADPSDESFGAVAWSEQRALRERPGFGTSAKKTAGGWELTGSKCFVGNADLARSLIVFAQIDPEAGWNGIGAFAVARDNPGLRIGERHKTLGLDCASFGQLTLEAAKVDDADRLEGNGDFARATIRFFAKYGLLVAARQVGLAGAAFDIAREYCDIRKAFGKPIGHFQAVAFTLADRLMDVEGARALCHRAAWAWDSGRDEKSCLLYSAQAIAQSHEAAMRCADDAVQLHGGAGFMRDVIVEKMMRDAKQMALVALTAEHADQLAAAIELDASLDPALVLPTPETQAVFT